MSNSTFVAISSDYRGLYKADIYKILSKPKGAIEHFRYRKKWIQLDKDCTTKKSLLGKNVIIVFKHVEDEKASIYIPIRKAVIIDYEYDEETEVYHYYFELGNYCNITKSTPFKDNLFFLKTENLSYDTENWKNVIEKVKSYFSDNFFYKIDKVIDEKGHLIKLNCDKTNHSYYYKFIHGKSYTLNLTVSNPNSSDHTLSIESSSSDINVVLTKKYFISAPYDKLRIPITTKSLDSFKEKSFISFYISDSKDLMLKEYENHIHILKEMNSWKPVWFGILSTLLIACTWLIKDKTGSLENIFKWQNEFDILALLYSLVIFISSSVLYALFNKK